MTDFLHKDFSEENNAQQERVDNYSQDLKRVDDFRKRAEAIADQMSDENLQPWQRYASNEQKYFWKIEIAITELAKEDGYEEF